MELKIGNFEMVFSSTFFVTTKCQELVEIAQLQFFEWAWDKSGYCINHKNCIPICC